MKISEPTFKFFEFDEKISAHRSGLDSAILKNSFKPPADYEEISTSLSIESIVVYAIKCGK